MKTNNKEKQDKIFENVDPQLIEEHDGHIIVHDPEFAKRFGDCAHDISKETVDSWF